MMNTIPALWRLKQEACEIQTSLGYRIRLCLKNLKQTNKTKKSEIRSVLKSVTFGALT
jgi:hypothetical protein